MSVQERLQQSVLKKLSDMKKDLPDEPKFARHVFHENEDESIREELLKQAEMEEEEETIDDDFFTSLSGPSQEEGSEKLVEIEYLGKVAYVDISFETLDDDLKENEYYTIVEALEKMAYSDKLQIRKNAAKEVESHGDKAITVIFRECRKFDLTNVQKKNELVHLISRLAYRSYKGRKLIKAVLEKATINQHIALSILAAGAVREKEAVQSILKHMDNPEFFIIGLDALLRIRDKNSVEPIINLINKLDSSRNDLRDQAIVLVKRFSDFGPEAVKPVFDAYVHCDNKTVRPIFTIALRSFKEDAIPVLSEVLEKESDENKLVPICMTLGGLKIPFATNLLVETYQKYPNKKRAVIRGFSHTNDSSLIPMIVKELKTTEDVRIKEECLSALAFLGNRDKDLVPTIKPFLHERRNKLYLDALNCLVRLGDEEAFHKYFHLLINGEEGEQYVLQKHLARMPFGLIAKMAEKMLDCPDDKAILLVSALQRANLLPREVGQVLKKILDKDPIAALKLEIYRLVGKHVNTDHELLSQDVLYDAKQSENNPRIVRELDHIIKNMKKEKGKVSTTRG